MRFRVFRWFVSIVFFLAAIALAPPAAPAFISPRAQSFPSSLNHCPDGAALLGMLKGQDVERRHAEVGHVTGLGQPLGYTHPNPQSRE